MPTPYGSRYGGSGGSNSSGGTISDITSTNASITVTNPTGPTTNLALAANHNVGLLAIDSALVGSPPVAPGPFSIISGTQAVVFTSGNGTLTLPGGGFPNGLLGFSAINEDNGVTDVVSFKYNPTGTTKALIQLVFTLNGSGATGTAPITYIAIGF